MGFNKKFFTTGGIVASSPSAPVAALDPFQNFETVTYTGNGSTQKITGYIRKGAAFSSTTSEISGVKSIDEGESMSFWLHRPPTGSGNLRFQTQSSSTYSYFAFIFREQTDGTFQIRSYFRNDISNYRFYYSVSNITLSTDWVLITWNQPSVSELNSSSNLPTNTLTVDGIDVPLYRQSNGGTLTSIVQDNPKFGVSYVSSYSYSPVGIKYDQIRYFNTHLTSTNITDLKAETYADATKSTTDIFGNGTGVALYELDEDALSSNFEQGVDFNGIAASNRSKILTSGLTTYNDFSISFWMNSDDFSYYSILMGTSDSYNTQAGFGIMTGFPNNGDLTFRASAGSGGVDITATGLSDGTWYHVVITQDSSTTTKKLYVNGTLEDTDTTSTIANGQGYSLILGGYSIYDNNPYDGTLDQIRIYSSALDQTDVTNLYRENNIPTTNLVTHYTFDNTYTDQVGSNNGAASNTTFVNGVYGGTPTNVNFLGMAFQPDAIWIKSRDNSRNHRLNDSLRVYEIYPNLTNQESSFVGISSYDSNGFTIGTSDPNYNANNEDYVAWCWRAAGAANTYNVLEGGTVTSDSTASGAGITAGTITTGWEVSANRDAGFSIVKYTGDGSGNNTSVNVGHGLSSAPELVIAKILDTSGAWQIQYAKDSDNLAGSFTTGKFFNHGAVVPTSTVFNPYYANTSNNFITYCFHSVDGYQKVGSYEGDNSTSGTTIDVGFRPRFLLVKNADTGSTNWYLFDSVRDPSNPIDSYLIPNSSANEADFDSVNFNDNGFELLSNLAYLNQSGDTYIYLAIA